jgi:hypothetical protein
MAFREGKFVIHDEFRDLGVLNHHGSGKAIDSSEDHILVSLHCIRFLPKE